MSLYVRRAQVFESSLVVFAKQMCKLQGSMCFAMAVTYFKLRRRVRVSVGACVPSCACPVVRASIRVCVRPCVCVCAPCVYV